MKSPTLQEVNVCYKFQQEGGQNISTYKVAVTSSKKTDAEYQQVISNRKLVS